MYWNTQLGVAGAKMIDEVKGVDIEEWNADPELGKFPIQACSTV